jgi:hypothetical protein
MHAHPFAVQHSRLNRISTIEERDLAPKHLATVGSMSGARESIRRVTNLEAANRASIRR